VIQKQHKVKIITFDIRDSFLQFSGNTHTYQKKSPAFRQKIFVGWEGLEPSTSGLKGHCSTPELPTHRCGLSRFSAKPVFHTQRCKNNYLDLRFVLLVEACSHLDSYFDTLTNVDHFDDEIWFECSFCLSHRMRSIITRDGFLPGKVTYSCHGGVGVYQ
jgi:hypothetical protein